MIEIYRNTSRKKLTVQNIPQMVFYCKQELAFQINKNWNILQKYC